MDGIYLVDETGGAVSVSIPRTGATQAMTSSALASAVDRQGNAIANLIEQVQTTTANQQTRMMARAMGMDVPSPGGGDGGGSYSPDGITNSYVAPDYGTNLWIAQTAVAVGNLTGIGTNTIADVQYEIQSRTNLVQSDWQSEGFIVGSELTNWTPLSVPQIGRANLFIRLKSWASSDGSGLPDWWELQYLGTTGIDSDALDSAGDGYTIYQKYLMNLNPNVFYTPAAPNGLAAALNQANNTALIRWLPSPAATGYTLEKTDANTDPATVQDFPLSAGTTSYPDSLAGNSPDPFYPYAGGYGVSYRIKASYTGSHTSPWSAYIQLQQPTASASITPGPMGASYLAVSAVPANATAVRLVYMDQWADDAGDTSFDYSEDIPVSSFTNGLYQLTASLYPPATDAYGADYSLYIETVDGNGNPSGATFFDNRYGWPTADYNWGTPFYDGRVQLKQNLIFQLRAAPVDGSFHFSYGSQFGYPSNYACASFYQFANPGNQHNYGGFDAFLPFEENYLFRNFVLSMTNVDTGGNLTTGVSGGYGSPYYSLFSPSFLFSTNLTPFQALLSTNNSTWMLYDQLNGSDDIESVGVISTSTDNQGETTISMPTGSYNWFGLPYRSINVVGSDYNTGDLVSNVVTVGHSLTSWDFSYQYNIYTETTQPQFQTVEYDFWSAANWPYYYVPLPGNPTFSPTNTSKLLITSVGNMGFQVAGYAKLAVANSVYTSGNTSVYGYLGQYFTNAYIINTNGVMTTNKTGILSPYGNFFATQPGPVALVTMPDPDTGAQGTCIVHCVSLNVDKNHDGTIDTSFSGPDVTSQTSPMEFWINNDSDGTGVGQDIDATKLQDSSNEVIQSMRDLEDFARLWICGVPSGFAMDGYQVTLSFQNCVGNPSIKLFASHEANGGYGYLTNTNIAQQYVGSPMNDSSLGMVSTSTNYVFPYLRFYNGGTQCLLFEGVTTGEGELVMTITDSKSNTVAQTGVWLDLHDVKDFLEKAVITNNASGVMSNWTSAVEIVQPAISSGLGNDTNLIVLVHGINVQPWDCLNDAETVYKRLYWSGFQGQFFAVKWPCNLLTPIPSPLTPTVFNLSEFQGYKASQAMIAYMTQLRSRFPGYRMNLLVHSQGNAVVSEALAKGAPFDTYILTQGAIPESAYDMNAPTNATIAGYDTGTHITPDLKPMGYHGAYTNLTGRIVNFYNPNDPVLAIWITDQELEKPSWYFLLDTYYYYDGTNSYYYPFTGPVQLIADPEESRAMVARSRTLSIGQSGPASGHGVIQSAVNLNTQFGFNDAFPGDHSAQWVWPIQGARPYFQQVLRSCQIIPAP